MPPRKTTRDYDAKYADYRHEATRKNNPSAAFASQGRVNEMPKRRYFYDPHLPPVLRFDDEGESDRLPALLAEATRRALSEDEAKTIAEALANRQPWLEWTGKREKRWFEVDPVAIHTHERVSALAAIQIAARRDVQRGLWADPEQSYHEAVQFYKHDVPWANRLILGDSLAVMSSLSAREDLAGKVQMIYVDPPYGIGYRSNFQPLVGNRNVGDRDADLTREPESVKAYRDTWTLGVHTWLTYLRDRLTVARELMADSGSIFVQINDENAHRLRAVMDEVFGVENFISEIVFTKTRSLVTSDFVTTICDYILWYAKDKPAAKEKMRKVMSLRQDDSLASHYEDANGQVLTTAGYRNANLADNPDKEYRAFMSDNLIRRPNPEISIEYQGKTIRGRFRTNAEGMMRCLKANRILFTRSGVRYKFFLEDYPASPLNHLWNDVIGAQNPVYAVQTNSEVIQRCMLMTTDPGDLVLDPTCGSGTTAYVAEQWGRRWITIDTSRVAVALARQRLLTAKFDYYETEGGDGAIGGGFEYKTVPHITLRSIAQNSALDPIFAEWDAILDENLGALNAALSDVGDGVRSSLLAKLNAKRRLRGRENAVTDADERRWNLPKDKWEHWQVPFDADPDYPPPLAEALAAYREAWRGKMSAVNASIAAAADQEVLVDQPKVRRGVTRVSGPFTVEAVNPPEESLGEESPIGGAPDDLDAGGFVGDDSNEGAFADSLTRLLREDGVRFPGNAVKPFVNLERMSDGGALHAEGEWENGDPDNPLRVAVSFGPQYGAVTSPQVQEALWTAHRRGYDALVFAGFAFDGAAQAAIEADPNPRVRVHMAHISPDVIMDGLLKSAKDSHLFTVSGAPRASVSPLDNGEFVVEMEGVDIYDPVNNTIVSENAERVAAWFLDMDYDGRTFCVSQAFFPNSGSWDALSRTLRGGMDAVAFAAFSGVRSQPFPAGANGRAAIKVIDPRGNEVMRTFDLGEGARYG